MAETSKEGGETIDQKVVDTIINNTETTLANAKVLQEVLGEEHPARKNIVIESISSTLDLGGFFMDEENSSQQPSYRTFLRVGQMGGDAIVGSVLGLVGRKTEDHEVIIQLMIDAGYEQGPVLCYFNLDQTLEGCRIYRTGLDPDQPTPQP